MPVHLVADQEVFKVYVRRGKRDAVAAVTYPGGVAPGHAGAAENLLAVEPDLQHSIGTADGALHLLEYLEGVPSIPLHPRLDGLCGPHLVRCSSCSRRGIESRVHAQISSREMDDRPSRCEPTVSGVFRVVGVGLPVNELANDVVGSQIVERNVKLTLEVDGFCPPARVGESDGAILVCVRPDISKTRNP